MSDPHRDPDTSRHSETFCVMRAMQSLKNAKKGDEFTCPTCGAVYHYENVNDGDFIFDPPAGGLRTHQWGR